MIDNKKIIIASGPVIIENGKTLLHKHGDDDFWKLIGGMVDLSDLKNPESSLENACKRRVKESMGFDIKIIKPLKSMMIPKPNNPNTLVVLIHYAAERLGEIKPGPEIKEWGWFDTKNLPEDCGPNVKLLVENYLNSK